MEHLRKITRPKKRRVMIKKSQDFIAFFFVLIILLGVSIIFLVLNKAWDSIQPSLDEGLRSAMPDDTSVNVTETLDKVASTNRNFDKLLPFLIIGVFAFVLIIAGSFMQHPIMIFVGIIIVAVVIFLAVIYSNLYNSIASTDEFATTNDNLGITSLIMQYLPVIVFIMAIGIGAAILWSKRGGGGL